MAAVPEGRIVTFYSYKGGTGRSMALANFAWILAASGKKVLVMDWDLEAPGLHRYFRPFLTDPELTETDGLIDAFWTLAGTALESVQASSTLSADNEYDRVVEALEDATRGLRPIEHAREAIAPTPSQKVRKSSGGSKSLGPRISLPQLFPSGGSIDLIGAGRQGATYSVRVNTFAWQRFYELDGARLLEQAKSYLRSIYDWVLIDSRTGVSDTAGICTMQMPDTIVACFTPNRQSVSGVAEVLHSIRSFRSPTIEGPAIRFFPVATRIENLEPRKLEASRAYFRGRLGEFLPADYLGSPREYWDKMEVPYKTGYAFEELLAVFGDATGALGAADTMLSHMEKMAQVIAEDPRLSAGEIVEEERELVLSRYALEGSDAGAAAIADAPPPPSPPGEDSDSAILRDVRAKEQVWRATDYSWRFLLSARELELLTDQDRTSFGRNMNFYLMNSEKMLRFSSLMDRAFFSSLILSVWICGIYWYFPFRSADFEALSSYARAIALIPFVHATLVQISTLVFNQRDDKPYGLKAREIMTKILLGPLRSEIRDYEQVEPPR
jgi:cellulose biosynthesis protein BcsQ